MSSQRCFILAYPGGQSAIDEHYSALANELAERGNRVIVILQNRRGQSANSMNNPAVYAWPTKHPTRLTDMFFFYRIVQQYRPQCVLAIYGSANVTAIIGSLLRIPCRMIWYHTLSVDMKTRSKISRWRLSLLRFRKRFIYKMVHYVLNSSEAARNDLINVYKVAWHKTERFPQSLVDPTLKYDIPLVQNRLQKIVSVGRMDIQHGQDKLIRALQKLNDLDIYVEFIGDGPERINYEKLAHHLGVGEKCNFLGELEQREVIQNLSEAAVSVLTGYTLILGSIAMGTPVITPYESGMEEMIKEGDTGLFINLEDVDTLSKHLRRIFEDRTWQKQLQKNARQFYLDKFETSKVVHELADWIENVTPLRAI